jgi:hypothetical protein
MTRHAYLALDILLAIGGLALFVYADLVANRGLRLLAVLVLTLALVFGIVLAARRHGE